jgi:hypothetical protein
VSGAGYGACDTVYFFFDGLRIGSAKPDAAGVVDRGGLSVPGQASAGSHTLTSSCERTGKAVLTSAVFDVTAARIHRPALMTSLPQPRDISLDPARLALSGIVALGFVLLIAFPFHLFNSTFEENYEEVRGWFGLEPRPPDYEPRHHRWLLVVFLACAGLLCAALSSDFGWNRTTLVTSVGMSAAILVTGLGFAIPTVLYMHTKHHEWGRLKILPGSILVAVVTVAISRAVGFETPGYVYGLLGVFLFHHSLDRRSQGRLTTATSLFVLAVCLGAWMARVPVSSMASRPDPALWTLVLELLLGGVFLLGLESLIVDLFPLRFLDGSRITAWNRIVWGVLFAVALFVLVHVLLSPGSGYVGRTENVGLRPVVIALFVGFGLFSLAFWAYFRYRPSRDVAAT